MSWPSTPLGEIFAVRAGSPAPQASDAFGSEGTPFIRAGSLVGLVGGGSLNDLEQVSPEAAHRHRLALFPQDTILFAKSGMSALKGHVYQLPAPAYVVSHLAALVPTPKVHSRYVRWALETFSPTRLVQDPAYPSVRLPDIGKMEIPLPPLAEQQRIAAILDQADALRRKRQETCASVQRLKSAIFEDMFGDTFSRSALGETVPLRALTKRITYGFTSPMGHYETGIPILTAKHVRDGFIDYSTCHFASQSQFDALTDKSKPEVGDILVTKDGTIGRHAIFNGPRPVCINQSVALVKVNQELALSSYVAAYIGSAQVQKKIDAMKKGNSIQHLQITEFANFPIRLPSLERQFEMERKLDAQAALERKAHDGMACLGTLFASLQHRAFQGEL